MLIHEVVLASITAMEGARIPTGDFLRLLLHFHAFTFIIACIDSEAILPPPIACIDSETVLPSPIACIDSEAVLPPPIPPKPKNCECISPVHVKD